MKTFIVACVAAIVIAVGAAVALQMVQSSTESAYSSATGVRV